MKILKRSIFPSQSRLGFTLIELMLVIAIISILSGVAYIGIQRAQVRVMNEKVTADLAAIENAMTQFAKDNNGLYPVPAVGKDKNLNCYHLDTSYAHDCSAADFIQAQIDNTLLTKRYLQEVPNDPRTGARYAYGVTRDGKYYQVAGIVEDQDGIFTARVAGSLHFTYPLKSLIRAYNGPNFVMDGEGYLPYSHDHRAITATLADITGTIKIDGKDASNDDVLKAGSVISAASGSFVTLYFSDGSITYLDGIGSPNGAVLRLLPHSAVEKNDEDGIITKIRLKLSSGKIWNKVVRLAEKSEFNVETTSAIAGVRGTEFGIDAAGTELIVLSGDVAARQKKDAETALSSDANQFLEYDSTDPEVFMTSQTASVSASAVFTRFYPPSAEEAMTTGSPLSSTEADQLKSKYYHLPYNNNLAPRLNEADAQKGLLSLKLITKAPNNPFSLPALTKIHAYEKGASMPLVSWISSEFTVKEPEGVVSINEALAFFDGYMGKSVSFVYEDDRGNLTGHSQPHLLIQDNTYLTYAMLYGEWEAETTTGGQQQQSCSGTLQAVVIINYSTVFVEGTIVEFEASGIYTDPPNCHRNVSALCNWGLQPTNAGTFTQNSLTLSAGFDGDAIVKCSYDGKADQKTITVLNNLHYACIGPDKLPGTTDDKGYWLDPACWVLGAPNQNCDIACDSQLDGICKDATNPGGTNWNDVGNIACLALKGGEQKPDYFSEFAPHFFLNRCYARDNTITNFTPNLCATVQGMNDEQRICRCI